MNDFYAAAIANALSAIALQLRRANDIAEKQHDSAMKNETIPRSK